MRLYLNGISSSSSSFSLLREQVCRMPSGLLSLSEGLVCIHISVYLRMTGWICPRTWRHILSTMACVALWLDACAQINNPLCCCRSLWKFNIGLSVQFHESVVDFPAVLGIWDLVVKNRRCKNLKHRQQLKTNLNISPLFIASCK